MIATIVQSKVQQNLPAAKSDRLAVFALLR